MQNAQGGVTKIYGKRGRRIRAAERLVKSLEIDRTFLKGITKELDILEKKNKLTSQEKDQYNELLHKGDVYYNSVAKSEEELATLKLRV